MCIQVGRASKSLSKALHSAGNNAWFDSPVMSRYHAEINLDSENETLILRDVGSMHGTCVNNSQVPSHVPTIIHDGDELVFGAEVKRGCETFPPCKFLINYDISPCKAANTFSFPESSDFDDEEDISFSGSSIEQDQTELLQNETTIYSETSLNEEVQCKNAAIFTRNNTPVSKKKKVDSLISQDLRFAHENPTKTLRDDTQYSDRVDITAINEEFASSFKEDEEEEPAHDPESHISGNLRTSIWTNEMKAIMNSDSDYRIQKFSESFTPESECQIKDRHILGNPENHNLMNKESPEAQSSEDKTDLQNNGELSNLSGESIKHPIETEIPSKNSCISLVPYNYVYVRDKKAQPSNGYDPIQLATAVVKKRLMPSCTEENLNSSSTSDEDVVSEPKARNSILTDLNSSKTTPLDKDQISRVEASNANSSEELWSQVLGEKLGKTAYFRAREFNKAKFHSMSYLLDDTRSSLESNLKQESRQDSLAYNHPKLCSEEKSLHKSSASDQENIYQNEIFNSNQYVFTEKNGHQNIIPGQGIDQGLETSNISIKKISLKNATISANKLRSGNEVQDSIQTDIHASPPRNHGKRKADALSENFCQEIYPWANSSLTLLSDTTTNLFEDLLQNGDQSTANVTFCPRPSKRRRVVESIGYVALGGFATAIGLFSILVATAPDFS